MFVIDQDGKFLNQSQNEWKKSQFNPGLFSNLSSISLYMYYLYTRNDKLELLYIRTLKKYSNLL